MTDENQTGDADEAIDRTDATDSYERVPLADWAGIEEHARRIAGRDSIEVTETEVLVRSGDAQFGVTREGTVDTGMRLHSFEKGDVEALYFDHDRERIRVYGPDGLAYEFRKP